MNLELELCVEKRVFERDGQKIEYDAYFVVLQDRITGEQVKAYLTPQSDAKYLLKSHVNMIKKRDLNF